MVLVKHAALTKTQKIITIFFLLYMTKNSGWNIPEEANAVKKIRCTMDGGPLTPVHCILNE